MTKKKSAALRAIVKSLDKELKVGEIADSSNNGLQVQNSGKVTKVACGVDGSMEFFETARAAGADLLIVHHGISWKDSIKRITREKYRWVKFLIENDMALYGCHLPLDMHPKYGNNALIGKALGLKNLKAFGLYNGNKIAMSGTVPGGMRYAAFKKRVEKAFGREVKEMHFGPSTVKKVGIVSGGGTSMIGDADEIGVDMFVSGEPTLAGRNLLADVGMNALFGGHYVTETFGVKALGSYVTRNFGVPSEFIDLGIMD